MKVFFRFAILGFLMFSLFHANRVHSQQIQFDNFMMNRGLPSNNVNAVDVDEHGHLWVGTDKGIVKFNGNRFFKIPGTQQLLNESVFSIRVFSSKNVWVGLTNGRLYRFNGKELEPYLSQSNGKYVNLFLDSKKMLWAATEGDGAFLISNPEELSSNKIKISHFSKEQDMPNDVYEVGEDLEGKLYFLTRPGIKVFNVAKDKVEFYRPKNMPPMTFNCMAVDSSGIYLGASQGLVILNPKDEVVPFKVILDDPRLKLITCVTRDKDGNIWFGTKANGIIRYQNGQFKKFDTEDGLPGNKIKSLFTDPEGNIWIGHYEKGITGYKGSVFLHFNDWPSRTFGDKINPASVYSLYYETANKRLWIGTDKGLFVKEYGITNSKFIPVPTPGESVIESIIDWDDHHIAIGNYGKGIFILNKQNLSVVKVLNSDRDEGSVNAIYKLNKNELMVAHQTGLFRLNVETGDKFVFNELDGIEATTILADDKNGPWIGTVGNGLFRCSGDDCVKFSDSRISEQTILCLQLSGQQSANGKPVFIGTENSGLHKVIGDKLVWDNNVIKTPHERISFINTTDEYSWFGTDEGIVNLNTTSGQFKIFDRNSGFTNDEIKPGVACFVGDSILAYGTSGGLYFLHPFEKKRDNLLPQLNIFNAFTQDTIPITSSAKLPFSRNNILFNVAPVSLSHPYSLSTTYKLTGFDSTWLQLNDDRQIRFQKLPPGSYQLVVRATIGENEKLFAEDKFNFTVLPPFWQTIPFYIFVAIGLTGSSVVVYKFNLKRALRKQQIRHDIDRKMAELEMKSLRSQMNPHFIFNSLQSIQNFLFENNNSLANEYLLKFSKLMRLILENSQHDFVPMKSDLMALELYMQLESLRMPNPMKYVFNIDEAIDPEQLAIPPLLLQPFVENAIWHGLHPKKTAGMIKISCSLHEKLLIFEIEDDGVGRSFIRDKGNIPGFKKESLGVKITEERIKILSERSQTPVGVEFEDLFDGENIPAGTRVRITIPFES